VSKSLLDTLIESPSDERAYLAERLIIDVTESLEKQLRAGGMSRSSVAKKLGKTPALVSQLLHGTRNMTLRTLSDLAWAAGRQVRIELPPLGETINSPTNGAVICSFKIPGQPVTPFNAQQQHWIIGSSFRSDKVKQFTMSVSSTQSEVTAADNAQPVQKLA
jgi:transcriptional regulator with XRE-family HTH domain